MFLTNCAGNGSEPCTNCPPIEGAWLVEYQPSPDTCDGGTFAVPSNTVQMSREGSVLRSVVDDVSLTGTLYDTYDFSLNGGPALKQETVSLRGRYKPQSKSDAGDEQLVEGTLTRESPSCYETRRFYARRF